MLNFYTELKPFTDFIDFTCPELYRQAPSDWLVVITDVRGSTDAIKAGHYKCVNMAGATTIVALANVLGTTDFPFVFGGDGATALVPCERRAEIERVLSAARAHANEAFGLKLVTGLIEHSEFIAAGTPISVARFLLPGGPSIAFFSGEGLSSAEKWVKSGRGVIAEHAHHDETDAIKGLSCRWAPLKSARGAMLSILVRPCEKGEQALATLHRLLAEIETIVDLEAPEANPIKIRQLSAERIWRAARAEARIQGQHHFFLAICKIAAEMILVRILCILKFKFANTDTSRYIDSLPAHSDFRKFDETLRMVIDCSPEMQTAIRALLERERAAGTIYFGLHASPTALMTCFLRRLEDGGHVHFVDGNDGGYAMAAVELKAQIAGKF
ncbi:DUF3095 family protein [Methylobacter sp.]|uniref:DUF3095 family protein n=1 Tax=Methylobacter sp. TaxID=2051955 RepID=UPI00121D6679|nr:DUF3095 family protein [Methylobacter sp.]TAK65095.1 MAG: DUF3095 family protein [Methylobacter sp.]